MLGWDVSHVAKLFACLPSNVNPCAAVCGTGDNDWYYNYDIVYYGNEDVCNFQVCKSIWSACTLYLDKIEQSGQPKEIYFLSHLGGFIKPTACKCV